MEKAVHVLNVAYSQMPSPTGDDTPVDVLENIDMDSYRVEVEAAMEIALAHADAEIEPVPTGAADGFPQPDMNQLSSVIRDFNDRFGVTDFRDQDRVTRFSFRGVTSEDWCERPRAERAAKYLLRGRCIDRLTVDHSVALSGRGLLAFSRRGCTWPAR